MYEILRSPVNGWDTLWGRGSYTFTLKMGGYWVMKKYGFSRVLVALLDMFERLCLHINANQTKSIVFTIRFMWVNKLVSYYHHNITWEGPIYR